MKPLDICLVRQSKRMCGPASLQMVLEYYGKIKSEKELKKETGATYFFGTKSKDIIKVAKKFGMEAKHPKNNSIEDLKKAIAKKNPPIIGWLSPNSGSHFSVVIGFKENKILIADPDIKGIREMEISDFSDRWLNVNPRLSFIKRLVFFMIMHLHNKFSKFSKRKYSPPIKKSNLAYGEMIL